MEMSLTNVMVVHQSICKGPSVRQRIFRQRRRRRRRRRIRLPRARMTWYFSYIMLHALIHLIAHEH